MIATPLPSRVRARVRAWVRLVVATCAALLLLTPAAIATATTVDEAGPGGLTLELAVAQGGVLPATSGTSFTITARNAADADAPAGVLTLWVGSTPLDSAAALTTWLAGGEAPGSMRSVTTQAVPALAAGDTTRWELLASAEDLGFVEADGKEPVTRPAPGV